MLYYPGYRYHMFDTEIDYRFNISDRRDYTLANESVVLIAMCSARIETHKMVRFLSVSVVTSIS